MQQTSRLQYLIATLACLAMMLLTGSAWAAPKYKMLHAFGQGQDGKAVWDSVLLDAHGNLYGTTSGGGTGCNGQGCGTVFELVPASNGGWSENILYTFKGDSPGCIYQGKGDDGCAPYGGLIFDPAGNLYGTTNYGGKYGYGTVFELTPGSGGWTESVLYSFGPDSGGAGYPVAGVVMDATGNLCGTAYAAFELIPGSGGWTEKVLHVFKGQPDGYGPFAGLTRDRTGTLSGTTEYGGTYNQGTVYSLRRTPGGKWKEQVLHSFPSFTGDGQFPGSGALVMDRSGNLYGTTGIGGANGYGAVYKLKRSGGGWSETVVHSFSPGKGGSKPGAGLVFDSAGNMYGTTTYGGSSSVCPGGCGVVFKMAPASHGKWKYTVLHSFGGADGANPVANLILDEKGNLYGTGATGGPYGYGVVFEITP